MTGLDTNVLVRYLTQDDPPQARRATQLIEDGAARGEEFFIASVVVCESVWVLSSAYEYSRGQVASALEQVLRTRQFRFDDKDLLTQSLRDYRTGPGDFADYLTGRAASQAGCSSTATFDRKLKGCARFDLLG